MDHPLDHLFSDNVALEGENDGEILSDDELPDGDADGSGDEATDAAPAKPVAVEVKKKTVRNPRNMLNEAKLCGPRGIIALKDHFKHFKFHGKGHEASDLNRLMRNYEHWAHRLYPKFHFDDCMAKIEKLGHKKQVQMYMNKYRTGMLQAELEAMAQAAANSADEEEPDVGQLNRPLDPLDSMLEEQIARSRGRTSVANTSGIGNLSMDNTFDAVRQTDNGAVHANALKDTHQQQQQTVKSPPVADEIRAKIEANRLKALELRKARLLALSQQSSPGGTENVENDSCGLPPS
uniref:TIMELESS-interacting protein n=1 Tax=Anopheles coluzzii TaxID=1518534 RepID=A0A8W7Q1H2_ANOCL